MFYNFASKSFVLCLFLTRRGNSDGFIGIYSFLGSNSVRLLNTVKPCSYSLVAISSELVKPSTEHLGWSPLAICLALTPIILAFSYFVTMFTFSGGGGTYPLRFPKNLTHGVPCLPEILLYRVDDRFPPTHNNGCRKYYHRSPP